MTRKAKWLAVLGTAIAVPASAVQYTPPVRSHGALSCIVHNVDTKPRVLTSGTLIASDGTVLSGCGHDRTVEPGEMVLLCQISEQTAGAYCRFEGTGTKLRGYIRLMDTGGSSTRLILRAE